MGYSEKPQEFDPDLVQDELIADMEELNVPTYLAKIKAFMHGAGLGNVPQHSEAVLIKLAEDEGKQQA